MKTGYCGSEITRDDSWLLEVAKVPQELRDDEPELMQTRWFDYRDLLPAQATYLFANRYDAIYREVFSQTRDYREAEKISTLMVEDIFKSSELLPMWRARQAADRIGCTYDFYLRFTFKRFWDRGWRYLPRPNQLYGEELVLDIIDEWESCLQNTLQVARKGRFKPDAYVGHPDQDAYYDYLVEQIKKREHQHMLLSRLVFREGALPLEIAGEHFSTELIQRAKFF